MCKIDNYQDIAMIFSCFHDGSINHISYINGELSFDVHIQYLAQRINKSFTKFSVKICELSHLEFSPWPNSENENITVTIDQLFQSKLEVLKGEYFDGSFNIVLNQTSPKFSFCGGQLTITAKYATVMDESGKFCNIDMLNNLSHEYWKEWKENCRNF